MTVHDPPEAENAPRFYEPWQPKTGDRVRVRLSEECPECTDWLGPQGFQEWQGEAAIVDRVYPTKNPGYEVQQGHRFQVTMIRDHQAWGYFAAAELELLDSAS